jgi:hypothetical protein
LQRKGFFGEGGEDYPNLKDPLASEMILHLKS